MNLRRTYLVGLSISLLGILISLSFFANFLLEDCWKDSMSQTIRLITGVGLLCLIPMLIQSKKRNTDIFEPIYLFVIVYIFHFVFKPIDFITFGSWFAKSQGCTVADLNRAIFYAGVGAVFFFWGYYSFFSKHIANKLVRVLPSSRYFIRYNKLRVSAVILLLTIVGCIGFIYYVSLYGDFYYFYNHMNEIIEQTRGLGPLLVIIRFFPIIACLLFYAFNAEKMTLLKWLVLLGLVLMVVLVSWQRMKIVSVFVGMLLIRNFKVSKFKINPSRLLLGTVGLISIFIIFSELFVIYRAYGISNFSTNIPKTREAFIHDALRTFNPTESFVIISRYVPEILNYQYGKTYLDAFILPIPRKLWPNKPLSLGSNGVFGETFFPELYVDKDIVLTTTILGEGFMNFGLFGIILAMTLAGVTLRVFWTYLQIDPTNTHRVLIYAALFGHLPIFIRSGFYTYFTEESQLMVPLLLVTLIIRNSKYMVKPRREIGFSKVINHVI